MHIPVFQKEVLHYLDPKPDENFIDCTVGEGGHALAVLERILPKGKLLGIDWSPELIQELKVKSQKLKVKSNLVLACENYAHLKEIVKKSNLKKVDGILFDLGLSSWHLEESGRGFSFLRAEPLDMRYNPEKPTVHTQQLTAEKVINWWSEKEIERVLKEYGEEQFARNIAKEIIRRRKIKPINSTSQLVEIIKSATPGWYKAQKRHFATKTFQALRIAVNDELNNLKKGLEQALEVLNPQGKLVVISFHSLEDRIIKNFFKKGAREGLFNPLTKKPVRPQLEEIKINPRARSARLRAAIKTKKP